MTCWPQVQFETAQGSPVVITAAEPTPPARSCFTSGESPNSRSSTDPAAELSQRMRDATPALRASFVAYLDRLTATHAPRHAHRAGQRLGSTTSPRIWPRLTRHSQASAKRLDRRRHIETYLTATAEAMNSRTAHDTNLLSAAAGSWQCTAYSTSPNGAGPKHRCGAWCFGASISQLPGPCRTPDLDQHQALVHRPSGYPPMHCCCNERPVCASVS